MIHPEQKYREQMSFERYPQILNDRKKRKLPFLFGLILFISGLFITLISLNIYSPSLVPNELRVLSLNKKQNIIFLGCDDVFPQDKEANGAALWKGRSDTIVLISCNPFKNSLNILNIPRDTKVKIPGHGIEKINFLNSVGGPIFTKKCLERLLRIHVDHYVIVNLQGLNKIIDEVGGVVINVPQRMQYQDHTAMLNINLFAGQQLLNGEQAVGFVRFRHDNLGDIGRIERQQEFMRAVIKKLMDPITFTKLPEVVNIYKKTILTDLHPQEIIKIANFIRNVPLSSQKIVILPGDFSRTSSAGYWIPNQKEINNLVRSLFYEEKNPKSFFRFNKQNTKDITISVFNGSRNDRFLGTKLTNLLREYGYTVLPPQDYESYVTSSKIYAQKANPEVALQVKYDIGNFGEILTGNFGPPDADVTILAGDDLADSLKIKDKR